MTDDIKFYPNEHDKLSFFIWIGLFWVGSIFLIVLYMFLKSINSFALDYNTLVGILLTSLFGIITLSIIYTIRIIRKSFRKGKGYGLFIAPEAILIHSFYSRTYLPHKHILEAEVITTREFRTKRTETVKTLWIYHQTKTEEHKISLEEIRDYSPNKIINFINDLIKIGTL